MTAIPPATMLTFVGVVVLVSPLVAAAEATLRQLGWAGPLVDWMWLAPIAAALAVAFVLGRWLYRSAKALLLREQPLELGDLGGPQPM